MGEMERHTGRESVGAARVWLCRGGRGRLAAGCRGSHCARAREALSRLGVR